MTDDNSLARGALLTQPAAESPGGLLTVPASIRNPANAHWQSAIFRHVIANLPPEVRLIVAAHAPTLQIVQTWPQSQRRRIEYLTVSPEVDFTAWCQDSILDTGASRNGMAAYFVSERPPRKADLAVVQIAAAALGAQLIPLQATFEGGNVLAGDAFILVGADTGSSEQHDSLATALRDLGEQRCIQSVGATPRNARSLRLCDDVDGPFVEELYGFTGDRQPIFHLDAFISPAGHAEGGRPRMLIGDPRTAVALIGRNPLLLDAESLAEELDEIAASIKRQLDCEVIRNPLPIIAVEHDGFHRWSRRSVERKFAGIAGLDDVLASMRRRGLDSVRVRRWCLATQNSATVFEDLPSGQSVILPSYAQGRFGFLDACETPNVAIWTQLGYRVAMVPGFAGFADAHGSAHCLFKLLSSPQRPASPD